MSRMLKIYSKIGDWLFGWVTIAIVGVVAIGLCLLQITQETKIKQEVKTKTSSFDKAVYFCNGKDNIANYFEHGNVSVTCTDGRTVSDVSVIKIPEGK